MKTLIQLLSADFARAIRAICPDAEPPEITPSTHAHYQCNNALKMSKSLNASPREIAQKIIDHLCLDNIEKCEIAGPGFINITLKTTFLNAQLNAQAQDSRLGAIVAKQPMRIVVEFSSPNIAKELHVGHLRSTIIGDSIARLLEFLGHEVIRLNHVGDWGTQFGMLIAYLQMRHPQVIEQPESADLAQLMEWYKCSKTQFDQDPLFKKAAQMAVVALQSGDKASLKAWRAICEISCQAFQQIYQLLDVSLLERGESFYNAKLPGIIEDLASKNLLTLSEGAQCIFLDGFKGKDGKPFPMIVQKSDGGFNYSTTDIAAMAHRCREEKAERIIVVTDNGQKLHFQMVEAACKKAGYLTAHFEHVTFGVVLTPEGKKFKSRDGKTEKLIDLLTEAIDRAEAIFTKRHPDLDPIKRRQMAQILGIDALKYADLSCLRTKDYTFSYDKMLAFEGNTAAFLLYAYVRIQGIKRKVCKNREELIELSHPSEIHLGLHVRRFGEILQAYARDLCPNRLADYLYELAEKFNGFFRDCRVDGSQEQGSRLALCELTGKVLAKGFEILGLKVLDQM